MNVEGENGIVVSETAVGAVEHAAGFGGTHRVFSRRGYTGVDRSYIIHRSRWSQKLLASAKNSVVCGGPRQDKSHDVHAEGPASILFCLCVGGGVQRSARDCRRIHAIDLNKCGSKRGEGSGTDESGSGHEGNGSRGGGGSGGGVNKSSSGGGGRDGNRVNSN